jgi:hypothetical protein
MSTPGFNVFEALSGASRPAADFTVCSRKGCREAARWQLLWNNPKLHTPERRKAWAACSDHVEWLQDYLSVRGLWKETVPLSGGAA